MCTKFGIVFTLAAAAVASAHYRIAEQLPLLDPLVLLGISLIVAGAICWKHAD